MTLMVRNQGGKDFYCEGGDLCHYFSVRLLFVNE